MSSFTRICKPWCPESTDCGCSQHIAHRCAGPSVFTSEYNIGNRPCCGGLRKCNDTLTGHSWCSATGKCPPGSTIVENYTGHNACQPIPTNMAGVF